MSLQVWFQWLYYDYIFHEQGLHFLEKYRFESTIGQQMKLIDYLQELWQDSLAHKKKKVQYILYFPLCLASTLFTVVYDVDSAQRTLSSEI